MQDDFILRMHTNHCTVFRPHFLMYQAIDYMSLFESRPHMRDSYYKLPSNPLQSKDEGREEP